MSVSLDVFFFFKNMNKHCKSLFVWGKNNKQQRQQQRFSSSLSAVLKNHLSPGVNPKINNMLPAYRAAVHPLILVSDSSIKMKEDTLTDMVSSMTENVGLVHQMPCELSGILISFIHSFYPPDICDGAGLSSSLEKVFFGTFHARMYLNRWADL